eukprot:TRINITY_DN5798_c0_g1_i1.p1 TRINITY_DN5798_c0_g1~~TRINITY_DN5798_c0_g1_i1.p1  ORF type:complete len:317 (+),score=96.70 TRINITY_DN5798_c0_g1_i1:50-952(+)
MAEPQQQETSTRNPAIPPEYAPLVEKLKDKTHNMFENGRVKKMVAAFQEKANAEGSLEFDDFFHSVFPVLFSDPNEGSAAEILNNKFFLKRCFSVMNKTKKGLTLPDLLEGIALMFSGDEDDLIWFHFNVYDVYENQVISQEEMFLLLESFLKTKLHLIEKEFVATANDMESIQFHQALLNKKNELGTPKLKEVIAHTFELAELNSEGVITFDKFQKAFKLNPDLFDWDEIAEDVMEAIEASIDKKALRNSITSKEHSEAVVKAASPAAIRTTPALRSSGSLPIDPTERELLQKELNASS